MDEFAAVPFTDERVELPNCRHSHLVDDEDCSLVVLEVPEWITVGQRDLSTCSA